jgi:hypothetical protein
MSENIGLNYDIEYAKTLITDKDAKATCHTKCSKIYPFTTENLSGYFNQLDFKDKKVLTVTGSGDHALNAILLGASEVHTFDINRYAKYHLNLKKAAIEVLDYGKFLSFFHVFKGSNLNKETYFKLRDILDDESKLFWDSLLTQFSNYQIRQALFRFGDVYCQKANNVNNYLNEEQYYELQKKINSFNISFIESDILDLKAKIDNVKYDLILLSNISDYIDALYYFNAILQYKKLILNLANNLNENGKIVFAYLYGILENNDIDFLPDFYKKNYRERIFSGESFTLEMFKSIHTGHDKDAVMIYTKSR